MNETVDVQLTPDELRHLISCGAALLQNLPEDSLPTYCHFNKARIIEFSTRLRTCLDEVGFDM